MPIKILCIIIVTLLSVTTFEHRALANNHDNKYRLQSEMPSIDVVQGNMPSKIVNAVTQDNDGFIWIGTNNGIARYDGIYVHDLSIHSDDNTQECAIKNIINDSINNYIWASYTNKKKLIAINRNNLSSYEISYKTESDKALIYNIVSISDSILLGCSPLGFHLINKRTGNTKNIYRFKDKDLKYFDSKRSFFWHKDKLYCSAGGNLYSLAIQNVNLIDITKELDNKNELTLSACSAGENTLLISQYDNNTKNVIFSVYDITTKEKQPLFSTLSTENDVCIADDGIWITTLNGLQFFRFSDQKLLNFNTSNTKLPDNKLNSIIKSKDQPIFFIGSDVGLLKLNYFASKFQFTDLRQHSTAQAPQVCSILKDSQGNTWTGTSDGLHVKPSNGTFFTKISIPNNAIIKGIYESPEHDAVIFFSEHALYTSDLAHHNIRQLSVPNKQNIQEAHPLLGGRILLATTTSISILNRKTGTHTSVYSTNEEKAITSCFVENDRDIWFADKSKTVCRLNLETLEVTKIASLAKECDDVIALRHTLINGISELWMATPNTGLYYKILGFPGTKRISSSKLLKEEIKSLEIDHNGHTWVSTNIGLVSINGNEVQEFTSDNFFICQRFTTCASSIGPNDELYFGGNNSFIQFSPTSFHSNHFFPKPTLASYKYKNSKNENYDFLDQKEYLYSGDSISIPAGIRSLLLYVRVMNYDRPQDNMIAWRIDNSTEWHTMPCTNYIMAYDLSEGPHTLEVKTLDYKGKPVNDDALQILLYKHIFYYETTSFRILMIALCVTIILLISLGTIKKYNSTKSFLSNEISIKNDMLLIANKELLDKQEIIRQKNTELAEINNNLENIVHERTQELEQERLKAVESNDLKKQFLVTLSHEIRTPMNAIVGFAKLLQMPECTDQEREEFSHLILESSNSMLSLIGNLLDTSRIERGAIDISFADLDIYRFIKDTWHILLIEKQNKDVVFSLDVDDNLKDQILVTDKDRLSQIFINLTYNAFKFTAQGHVKIVARKIQTSELSDYQYSAQQLTPSYPDGVMLAYVEDTGIGMPKDKLDAIFEPFLRLETNKVRYGGLGLGLNIVKNLVRLLGGEVWVTSSVGVGSTFYFYIPFGLSKTTN